MLLDTDFELTKAQKIAIELICGKQQSEIAKIYDVSRQYVNEIYKDIKDIKYLFSKEKTRDIADKMIADGIDIETIARKVNRAPRTIYIWSLENKRNKNKCYNINDFTQVVK